MRRQSVHCILIVGVALGCSSSPGSSDSVPENRGGDRGGGGSPSDEAGRSGASATGIGGSPQGSGGMGNAMRGGTTSSIDSTPNWGGVDAGGATAAQIPTKPQGSAGTLGSGSAIGGSAGRSVVGVAGSYGNPDTTDCPSPWPQTKVLPTVGIYFFGPDPGPCSQTTPTQTGVNTSTFSYKSGRIDTITNGDMVRSYTWEQGVLTASEWRTGAQVVTSSSYVWATDAVTETLVSGEVRRYVLGASGYPKEVWVSSLNASFSPYMAVRYEYGDCRLARRVVLKADGSVDELTTSVFEYDSKGHIVKQRYGSTLVETFDYSCW